MDFIKKYFDAEFAESLVFLGMGVLAMAAAAWFFFGKNDALLRGAAWPLAVVALIQIGVGLSIALRSPKDIARVEQFAKNEPTRLQSEELPRMEQVMRQFSVLRWVEISLIAAGIFLAFFFKENPFWRGIGIGLAVQAALMLGADYFAEVRGHVYLAELRNFIRK